MFSDKIKKAFGGKSLSKRLAVSVFLISCFTLGATSLILFQSYKHFVKKLYTSQLKGYMSELETVLEEMQNNQDLLNTSLMTKWVESELTISHDSASAMLVSKDKEIIALSTAFPLTLKEAFSLIPEGNRRVFWHDQKGLRYIIGGAKIYNDNEPNGYVFAARNLEKDYKKMNNIFIISLWVSLFTSFITAVLSFVFSSITLSPIISISSYIKSIKSNDLHKRLNPEEWPAEIRPVANSFNEMLTSLEDNFTRLNQFSSDLAHELRTPIHQMKIAIEVTLSKERTSSEYMESLSSTLESAQRLNKLVEDILFIARAESKNTALQKNAAEVEILCERIKDFFALMLEEKALNLDISGAKGIIEADRNMISRALINIINNAATRLSPGGNIIVSSKTENNHFVIDVSNDGPSIPEDSLNNLFDRFFKLDYSRKDGQSYGGSGLGLSIAQSIMHLHDGFITVKNIPGGKGVTFSLVFPLAAYKAELPQKI